MGHDIWNPWHGCTKCSPGCKNCYMYAMDKARGVLVSSSQVHKTGTFKYPLQKYRKGDFKIKSGERIRVNMTSDTFLPEADEWRDDMWAIIRQRPDVIFWILTKRPERFAECLPADWGNGYENVMLNITCEDQVCFARRIRHLLNIPAKHKGLCLAPLLEYVNIEFALKSGQIEEVCVGGENYDNPRPCHYEWVRKIALQCQEYKTNFCFYETGTHFVVNGATYDIVTKAKQSHLAFMCQLNQKYYDLDFKLKNPDGSEIESDKLWTRRFNKNKCLFCANQNMCNGCANCGKCCEPVEYIERSEMEQIQNDYVRQLIERYKDGTL